jgi:phosphatidylserine synthase
LILLWVICDMLDGYFARKYNTTSTFWKILDSFADILLYVLNVVFLYFSLHGVTLLGWIIILVFLFTSMYRLAYFFEWGFMKKWNNLYYTWMPVYFHLILFQIIIQSENTILPWISIVVSSFLMISNLPFRKFWLSIGFGYILTLFIVNNSISLWLF